MMKMRFFYLTPLIKQCWVTLGVSLAMAQLGMVLGYSSVLVPQLMMPGSSITIDDNDGSWIASLPAITTLLGNLAMPNIMAKYGRKIANITTLVILGASWICIALSPNLYFLLATRCLQGAASGMIATLGPVLIGEYASPTKRGAFLMGISLFLSLSVLVIHALGPHLGWKTTAIALAGFTAINLLIVISSPESPSWLAEHGRYEECKRTFRWLRGDDEDDELMKLIALSSLPKDKEETPTENAKMKMAYKMRCYKQTLKKNEVYKPLVVVSHLYAAAQWSGVNFMASYAVEYIETAVGKDVDIPTTMLTLNLTRLLTSALSLIIIQKVKRRSLFFSAVGLNATLLFLISAYTYMKENETVFGYDFYIGMTFIHALIFSSAIGAVPLCYTIAGELFPLRYRSLACGISSSFFSVSLFIHLKILPFLLFIIGVYGFYLLSCGLLIYFLIVVGVMLPETKDKTLQDIEEEFRGPSKQVKEVDGH